MSGQGRPGRCLYQTPMLWGLCCDLTLATTCCNTMTSITAPCPAARAGLLATLLVLSACSTTAPVVYSARSDAVQIDARTQADIAQCSKQADARIGRNGLGAQGVASRSAQTAGIGFAATAVGSVVAGSRDAWQRARGAAAGGATGMAAKLLLEWNEPDEVFQKYVERCLAGRGHEVLGWR